MFASLCFNLSADLNCLGKCNGHAMYARARSP